MAIFNLPVSVWRTPETWGIQFFYCTWEELCEIAASLRNDGMDVDSYDAEQYHLVGDSRRGSPRGWYRHADYSTADGHTLWQEHCVLLDQNMKPIREGFASERKPAQVTAESEKELLMRALAGA